MRSLNTGFTEMCALVADFDFDVFGVTETWLHPGTPSYNYNIPGYTMLRCDRQDGTQEPDECEEGGGGVAMYIRDGLVYRRHTIANEVMPGVEALCVVLRVKGRRLGLCVVYRPPGVRYTCLAPLFHSLFVDLAVEVNSVIYLGDTNIDLTSKTSNESKYLRRLLRETNTVQLIKEPTRVTESSATLLDHIIVDRSAEVKRTGVIGADGILDHRGKAITDHKLIYCDLLIKKNKPEAKYITYRDFSKFNSEQAVYQTAQIEWGCVQEMNEVNDIEKFITSSIREVFDTHAPIVTKRVTKKKAPWLDDEMKALTREKCKLRQIYWKSRNETDWENYKKIRNQLNVLLWKTKKNYFTQQLLTKQTPKEFWDCIKQCDVTENKESELSSDFQVNDINKYFAEMGSGNEVDRDSLIYFMENKRYQFLNDFKFTSVTEDNVKSVMNGIKSRAVGSDEISIQMVKAVSPYAIGAITHLVNESLRSGVFPQAWKTSIVRPLPKTISPSSIEQLRPISILPAISKIIEKIVICQITSHINALNLLPELQSGFRRNHSTCTALVNLFSDLIDARDKGRYSSLVMLDYSKAFDSMNHEMLVAKMRYYGFSEDVTDWISSYLRDRLQVTRLGSETSEPLGKEQGVPQGSCLGPILFNLYTADFPRQVQSCTAHLYADDSQLHLSYEPKLARTAIDQINADLESISRWSVINGLKLNSDKCTVLHTAPHDLLQTLSESGAAVTLGGGSLTVCDKVKTLGVVLDSGLSFSEHVTHASQRALGRLRGLYRFRSLLPESAKLKLVQSLILSVFYYCYPAYGNSISGEDAGRIQRLQNSAIRFVFGLRRFDHVSPYREVANLLPMEAVCRMLTCCMTHKVLMVGEPQYLSKRLLSRDEVSQRGSRHGGRLHFPKVKLEFGKKSFSYYGPKLYNDLPDTLKVYEYNTFKKKLKVLLCTYCSP